MAARGSLGCLQVGEVLFDAEERALWVEGRRVQLSPRLAALLDRLVRSAPRTVAKNDLLDDVWKGSVVSEAALTQRIKELRAILGDEARHPRYIETVARRGYRLVAPVRAVRPPEGDAAIGVPSPPAPPEAFAPSARKRPGGWWRWLAAAGGGLLLAGVAVLWSVGDRHEVTRSGPVPPIRRSLAVLGFANLASRPAEEWLEEAFRHLLATELSAGGRLRVAAPDVIQRVRLELNIASGGPLGAATAHRVGQAAGVDLLVTGGFLVQGEWPGGVLRLDVAVQEVSRGETLITVAVTRPLTEMLELVNEAGTRLREGLGLPALTAPEREALAALLPSSPPAARSYALGLVALNRFNFTGALDSFQAAAAADPESPVVQAALADVWDWIGDQQRALEASRLAWQLSGRLPREVQLVAEEGFRERLGDWPRAVELARALYEFFPDNLDYGLSLVSVLAKSGDDRQAEAVLAALRRLPEPLGSDPRLDLAEAWLADAAPARKLAAAARAAASAEAAGAQLLLAAARLQQGMAWRTMGDLPQALAAFDEARRIRLAAGDAWGVGRALEQLAALALDRGDVAAAAAAYEEALAIARAAGATEAGTHLLCDVARTAIAAGDFASARAALAEARETLPTPGGIGTMRKVELEFGFLAAAEDRPAEAAAIAERLLAASGGDLKSVTAARAALLRAQALAAGPPGPEAVRAAADAVRAAHEHGDFALALGAAIVEARTSHDPTDLHRALRQLEQIRDEAARRGLTPIELEALAAIGELHARRGDRGRARDLLAEVTQRARRQGLLLLARRAERQLATK